LPGVVEGVAGADQEGAELLGTWEDELNHAGGGIPQNQDIALGCGAGRVLGEWAHVDGEVGQDGGVDGGKQGCGSSPHGVEMG